MFEKETRRHKKLDQHFIESIMVVCSNELKYKLDVDMAIKSRVIL